MPLHIVRSVVVLGLFAAAFTASAAAGGGPPSFNCDPAHTPAPGATYKNFTVSGNCRVSGAATTVTGNVSVSTGTLTIEDGGALNVAGNLATAPGSGVGLWGNGTLHVGGNMAIDHSVVNIGTFSFFEPITFTVGGNVSIDTGDLNASVMNSTFTFVIGGNFTGVDPYNVVIGPGSYIPGVTAMSHIEVDGRTTMTRDHSGLHLEGNFGPIVVADSDGGGVEIDFSTVSGGVALVDNHTSVVVGVSGNTISGDLDCSGNVPAPTNADIGTPVPNAVAGRETGQCIGL